MILFSLTKYLAKSQMRMRDKIVRFVTLLKPIKNCKTKSLFELQLFTCVKYRIFQAARRTLQMCWASFSNRKILEKYLFSLSTVSRNCILSWRSILSLISLSKDSSYEIQTGADLEITAQSDKHAVICNTLSMLEKNPSSKTFCKSNLQREFRPSSYRAHKNPLSSWYSRNRSLVCVEYHTTAVRRGQFHDRYGIKIGLSERRTLLRFSIVFNILPVNLFKT